MERDAKTVIYRNALADGDKAFPIALLREAVGKRFGMATWGVPQERNVLPAAALQGGNPRGYLYTILSEEANEFFRKYRMPFLLTPYTIFAQFRKEKWDARGGDRYALASWLSEEYPFFWDGTEFNVAATESGEFRQQAYLDISPEQFLPEAAAPPESLESGEKFCLYFHGGVAFDEAKKKGGDLAAVVIGRDQIHRDFDRWCGLEAKRRSRVLRKRFEHHERKRRAKNPDGAQREFAAYTADDMKASLALLAKFLEERFEWKFNALPYLHQIFWGRRRERPRNGTNFAAAWDALWDGD